MNNEMKNKSNLGLIVGIVVPIVLVLVGILLYFLVIKNKSQVLTCTLTNSINGITLVEDLKMDFKNGYFTAGKLNEKLDGSTLSSQELENAKNTDLCNSISLSGNDAIQFANCNQEVNGNDIIVSVDLVPGDVANNKKVDINEGREMFEKAGFTCNK